MRLLAPGNLDHLLKNNFAILNKIYFKPRTNASSQHFSKTLNRFLETLPIRRQAAESADTGGERVLLQHSHLLRSRLPEAHRRRILVSFDSFWGLSAILYPSIIPGSEHWNKLNISIEACSALPF